MLLTTTPQHFSFSFSPPPLATTSRHCDRLMRSLYLSSLSLLRTLSSLNHCHHHRRRLLLLHLTTPSTTTLRRVTAGALHTSTNFVEHFASTSEEEEHETEGTAVFEFDEKFVGDTGVRGVEGLRGLEVKELEELPEQWRRSKLAWLCKELPTHKSNTVTRLLNAQRKWVRQDDAMYLVVHCLRIRENETAFKVYKWMMQQHWYRFDFSLATKLAEYIGKERKYTKCREIYNDIINQGHVPSESTFHILIVAYLSAPTQDCLDEAFTIYTRMIQLGGYQPRLSLHNSLFKALVSRPGRIAKKYLKQAEYVYHNLVTSGMEINKDIYGGLIWLHSYQDPVDRERINELRKDIQLAGIEEGEGVLLSILRACSKEGDVEEAEKIWSKILGCKGSPPSAAFVYSMEVYSKIGNPMKSLEKFREMQNYNGSTNAVAYHKIIEVLCKVQEIEHAEQLMREFIDSGMKPLIPSYIDLLLMYYRMDMHDKLELTFFKCLEKCRPNRIAYNIYLGSLVKTGNLKKAGEVFYQMLSNVTLGVDARSCNTILIGYLSSGDYVSAEKIHDLMCQKKYEIEAPAMEKLKYVLSLRQKEVKKHISLKLSKEQREILLGLLLGGLRIDSDEGRKNHTIRFEFNQSSDVHSVLHRHLYDQYHEWLDPSCMMTYGSDNAPYEFSTISTSHFGFYADQFWPKHQPGIPKLIHRWLSPRVLAYWYMYGGRRTTGGDILLKLKGSCEGVEKVVKALKSKSLDCRVKRKGRTYWIGLLGSNSSWFEKLVEPYVLDDLKNNLKGSVQTIDCSNEEAEGINFTNGSDSDQTGSDYSDNDNNR